MGAAGATGSAAATTGAGAGTGTGRTATTRSVRAGVTASYTIPPEGAIQLSAPPGEKNLLVTFSLEPESKPVFQATGLFVEQSSENAIYVASGVPAAPVSFSIKLAYR